MSTVVDGYTKAGANAAFAPIGHTHDGGGSSAGITPTAAVRAVVDTWSSPFIDGGGNAHINPTSWSYETWAGLPLLSMESDGLAIQPTDEGLYDLAVDIRLFWTTPPDIVSLSVSTMWEVWTWTLQTSTAFVGSTSQGIVHSAYLGITSLPAFDAGSGAMVGCQVDYNNGVAAGSPLGTSMFRMMLTKRT